MLAAWAAVSLTFFSLRLAAGDPLAPLLSQGLASPEQIEQLRQSLGLDRPVGEQYLRFLGGLLRGDFGRSFYSSRPVALVLSEQLPYSLALGAAALVLGMVLGALIGVGGGWSRHRSASRVASGIAVLSTSIPVSFTGVLWLWFSLAAAGGIAAGVGGSSILSPALVLGFASSGAIGKVLQAGLFTNLRAPFVLAARAHGIGRGPRLLWHALRPALATAVSLAALEAAFLFGGTVITETVFARPGMGRLLVSSILQGDFPVVQGVVVVSALLYSLTQIAGDLAAQFADPRWETPS